MYLMHHILKESWVFSVLDKYIIWLLPSELSLYRTLWLLYEGMSICYLSSIIPSANFCLNRQVYNHFIPTYYCGSYFCFQSPWSSYWNTSWHRVLITGELHRLTAARRCFWNCCLSTCCVKCTFLKIHSRMSMRKFHRAFRNAFCVYKLSMISPEKCAILLF